MRYKDHTAGDSTLRVLFWPRNEFDRLAAESPGMARLWGVGWDDHRTRVEKQMKTFTGLRQPTVLCRADYASFLISIADFDEETGADILESYPRHLDRHGAVTPWPPERNARCWCGSGRKYKQCCRLRGFAAVEPNRSAVR